MRKPKAKLVQPWMIGYHMMLDDLWESPVVREAIDTRIETVVMSISTPCNDMPLDARIPTKTLIFPRTSLFVS